MIKLTCNKCNKEFQIKKRTYQQRIRRNSPNYCKECMKEYSTDQAKLTKQNMSDERKKEYHKKLSESNKKYWDNVDKNIREKRINNFRKNNLFLNKSLTLEERKAHGKKIQKGKEKMSEEDIRRMNEKISKTMKIHHANKTEEEKEIFSQKVKDGMNNMSKEEKENMKNGRRKWWNNLSQEEKINYMNNPLKGLQNYWDNISEEDKNKRMINLCNKRDIWWELLPIYDKMLHIRNKLISSKGKNNLHKRFEYSFNSSYISKDYYFKEEVVTSNGNYCHSWDYGIYDKSNNQLNMIIDLDGSYYHADSCDYDGIHSKEEYDERRGFTIPSNIKHLIIQESKFDKYFNLLIKYLKMDYNEYLNYKFRMLKLMPFPHPKYLDNELMKSYYQLCKINCNDKYHNNLSLNTRLGDRLILHHHESIYRANVKNDISPYNLWYNDDLIKHCIENRIIYQSHLNINKLVQSFNISYIGRRISFDSAGRAKVLINKYLNDYDTIFDPFSGFSGRMLGTISLGKRYIGQDISEIHVDESKQLLSLIQKYGINCNVELKINNSLLSTGEYPCLFTSLSNINNEKYLDIPLMELNSDKIIDILIKNYKCDKYVFIVNNTLKYKDYIIEKISDVYDNLYILGIN